MESLLVSVEPERVLREGSNTISFWGPLNKKILPIGGFYS